MVQYNFSNKKGNSVLLYFSTNDGKKHFVPEKRDKEYIKFRKNIPALVFFYSTNKETTEAVFKAMSGGEI